MSVPATAEQQASPNAGVEASSTGRTGATNAQEPRADPTSASDAGTQEQPQRGPDFFRQAFNQLRGYTQSAAPAPSSTEPPAKTPASQAPAVSSPTVSEPGRSEAQPSTPPANDDSPSVPATTLPTKPPATSSPNQIVLTPEEFERRLQAETDRRLAKQKKEDEERAAREREVELRRTNPFEYARLMEAKEQELEASREETKRLSEVVSKQLFFYDRNVLDVFVGALPESERKKVIADAEGIEGRKATATQTLKALRSSWLAEGRASAKAELMKDQTFIKEILARYGASTPEPAAAPVAVRPAASDAAEDTNARMNSWMRESAKGSRAISGR